MGLDRGENMMNQDPSQELTQRLIDLWCQDQSIQTGTPYRRMAGDAARMMVKIAAEQKQKSKFLTFLRRFTHFVLLGHFIFMILVFSVWWVNAIVKFSSVDVLSFIWSFYKAVSVPMVLVIGAGVFYETSQEK